jgi:Uma2 family endonuclease
MQVEDQALAERRRALGHELFDEVWEGTYHMAPAPRIGHARLDGVLARVLGPYADAAGLWESGPFNLGDAHDYRVPDRGYHRGQPDDDAVYLPTAAVVVEILSPGDETLAKLPFYTRHGVDEVFVVTPPGPSVTILVLDGDDYVESARSDVLGIGTSELAALLSRR